MILQTLATKLSETNEGNQVLEKCSLLLSAGIREGFSKNREESVLHSYTPGSTNIAGWEIHLKMYLLWKMVVFHCYVSLLVYWRVYTVPCLVNSYDTSSGVIKLPTQKISLLKENPSKFKISQICINFDLLNNICSNSNMCIYR